MTALGQSRQPQKGCAQGEPASEKGLLWKPEQAASQIKFFFPRAQLPASTEAVAKAKAEITDALNPTLTAGLVALCRAKPEDPVKWLGAWLTAHNPKAAPGSS